MPYGRFDLDARAVFEQNGVEPRIRPCYVDDETVIRMVGKGLGLSMMAEMMIRGQLDGVRVLPVHPAAGRELGWGCIRARRCQRGSPGCAAACWNSSRTRRGRAQRNRDGEEKMRKGTWRDLRPEIALVWRLSLPAILTQITTIVMQYIDSAMVGARGANASAAIGLVASSTWLFGGLTSAVAAGFYVQVAHQIGAENDAEARNVVRHGLLTALVLSGAAGAGRRTAEQTAAGAARRRGRAAQGRSGVFSGVCAGAAVPAAQCALLRLFAVQRRYGHAEHPERRDVRTGCGVQHTVHPALWRARRGAWNGAGLCGDQPCDGVALLLLQRGAAVEAEGNRPV